MPRHAIDPNSPLLAKSERQALAKSMRLFELRHNLSETRSDRQRAADKCHGMTDTMIIAEIGKIIATGVPMTIASVARRFRVELRRAQRILNQATQP